MKIDKQKLMKTAWEIAKNGFYNAALKSIIGKESYAKDEFFTESAIEITCRSGLDTKINVFYLPHVQKAMTVNFTVKDFFAESLKTAWAELKKQTKQEIEKQLEREQNKRKCDEALANAAEINKNAPKRELVAADKYSIGQKLHGFIITELGREFRPDVDIFSAGITPDTDYVQYAYFN